MVIGTAQQIDTKLMHPFEKFRQNLLVKVVDSCWISSTEWSDTFRSVFVYGKKQESRKKNIITVQKKCHLPEEV